MKRFKMLYAMACVVCSPAFSTEIERPATPQRAAVAATREAVRGDLRDPSRIAMLIEQLDAVRASGDVLPVHALELSIRKAAERELAPVPGERGAGRGLELGHSPRSPSPEEAKARDKTYRTAVASPVAARDAPPPVMRRSPEKKSIEPDEVDFERSLRAVVHELSELDGIQDDPGLGMRRELLVRLLEIAQARERARRGGEPAGH